MLYEFVFYYRVSTKTTIPSFKRNEFSTMRRFSDFLGIHELLISKYVKMGRIVPPAPSKNILGNNSIDYYTTYNSLCKIKFYTFSHIIN